MFGWRARIGFISPNLGGLPGTLLEMEHLAPEGVAFLTRFVNGPASLATADLLALAADVEPLARSLVQKAELDVILMAGAPVMQFLRTWLLDHIGQHDRSYAAFLKEKGVS